MVWFCKIALHLSSEKSKLKSADIPEIPVDSIQDAMATETASSDSHKKVSRYLENKSRRYLENKCVQSQRWRILTLMSVSPQKKKKSSKNHQDV